MLCFNRDALVELRETNKHIMELEQSVREQRERQGCHGVGLTETDFRRIRLKVVTRSLGFDPPILEKRRRRTDLKANDP